MLLAVTVRLTVGAGKRVPAFYLLVASVVSLLVDRLASTAGCCCTTATRPARLLDAGWIAFYILWGAAALHPSMRTAVGSARPTTRRRSDAAGSRS